MKRLAIVALALFLAAGTASAGTITAVFNGGVSVDVTTPVLGAVAVNTSAGSFHITVTDPTGLESLPTQFDTFCVDLTHHVYSPDTASLDVLSNWNLASTTTAGKLAASWLLNNFFANGAGIYGTAAYQIAIWEALYETTGTFNVLSGNTFFASTATGAAQNLLNIVPANTVYANWLKTADIAGTTFAQDFGAPVPDGGATLMLLGGALMGLGALRRKFRG